MNLFSNSSRAFGCIHFRPNKHIIITNYPTIDQSSLCALRCENKKREWEKKIGFFFSLYNSIKIQVKKENIFGVHHRYKLLQIITFHTAHSQFFSYTCRHIGWIERHDWKSNWMSKKENIDRWNERAREAG